MASVKQLSAACFLSERQFQRQFKEYAGMGPKLFSRIVRFLFAANFYGETSKSLTDIALDAGYYDQSHFIHDFKKFSNLQPHDFFSGATGATDWRD